MATKPEGRARTALRFRLSDGRPLVQTMKAPIPGLSKRKGGAFDPVYFESGVGTCFLEPGKGRELIGVVVADNGREAECWVVAGVTGPKQ